MQDRKKEKENWTQEKKAHTRRQMENGKMTKNEVFVDVENCLN